MQSLFATVLPRLKQMYPNVPIELVGLHRIVDPWVSELSLYPSFTYVYAGVMINRALFRVSQLKCAPVWLPHMAFPTLTARSCLSRVFEQVASLCLSSDLSLFNSLSLSLVYSIYISSFISVQSNYGWGLVQSTASSIYRIAPIEHFGYCAICLKNADTKPDGVSETIGNLAFPCNQRAWSFWSQTRCLSWPHSYGWCARLLYSWAFHRSLDQATVYDIHVYACSQQRWSWW